MKKYLIGILTLITALCVIFCFVACNTDNPNDNGDNGDNGQGTTPPNEDGDTPGGEDGNTPGGEEDDGAEIDWDNTGLEGLALIYNNKARFQVVYTREAGSSGIRTANEFVKKLRALKIDVDNAVSDASASDVRECEIIFGSGARNRGEDVAVSDKYLGRDGRTIKVVGTRVVIAGGNEEQFDKAANRFVNTIMGIKSETSKLEEFAIASDFLEEALTEYSINSVKIAGIDIREFVVVEDFSAYTDNNTNYFVDVKDFRDDLYDETGIWLEYVREHIDEYEHKIIFRYTNEMDERGFAAYVEGGDFVIECSYANAFDRAYRKLMNKYVFDQTGDVRIPVDINYYDTVSEACYADFGAEGNGVANDYQAIYDTHVFANEGGQKVVGTPGAVYRIDDIPKSVPVKTDVDFRGASFIVNDVGDDAYTNRNNALFTIARDAKLKTYKQAALDEMAATRVVDYNTTEIPWLAPYITDKSHIVLYNENHKDFVRFGANENSGSSRHDVFIIYPDGTLDPETEVCFNFETVTRVEVYTVTELPITVENGHFTNICCKAVAATEFKNDYQSYKRGFVISRPNVTIKNITHTIEGEPDLDIEYSKYGRRDESYPYYGFFYFNGCYNVKAIDCELVGHTVYYEDKPATSSTGGKVPDPVPMGSYDITISKSVDVYFYNVKQAVPSTGLGDSRYWGIMASNYAKNLYFEGCRLSRIDAHSGFWDCTVIDTELGHTLNVIGGGKLYLENVTKLIGDNFMALRSDYGGTFRGDITIKNCTLIATKSYNSWSSQPSTTKYKDTYIIKSGYSKNGANGYWTWDFGYDCYLGKNVVIDNFTSYSTNVYVFPTFKDEVFEKTTNLHITESITFKNMAPVAICPDSSATVLNSIPVTVENGNGGKSDSK